MKPITEMIWSDEIEMTTDRVNVLGASAIKDPDLYQATIQYIIDQRDPADPTQPLTLSAFEVWQERCLDLPPVPEVPSSARNYLNPEYSESSPTYVNVRYTDPKGKNRVALCRGGLQWLLQRCTVKSKGTQWRTLSYCVTADALAREWANKTKTPVPSEVAALPYAMSATNHAL